TVDRSSKARELDALLERELQDGCWDRTVPNGIVSLHEEYSGSVPSTIFNSILRYYIGLDQVARTKVIQLAQGLINGTDLSDDDVSWLNDQNDKASNDIRLQRWRDGKGRIAESADETRERLIMALHNCQPSRLRWNREILSDVESHDFCLLLSISLAYHTLSEEQQREALAIGCKLLRFERLTSAEVEWYKRHLRPLIKGGSGGWRIYHVPGGRYYDKDDRRFSIERAFYTENEAREAGWRKSKR
ncbi:MAG: hypothetical protein ACYDAR_20760, partial [Thermomicrobiales bacterium]